MTRKQKLTIRSMYQWIFQPKFFAGIEAELEFEELSVNNGYIVEKIPQDKKSFQKYLQALGLNSENFKYIKRGDYLVRKPANLEVEVKCFTAQTDKYGNRYYTIKYREVKGLEALMEHTKTSICFAIFERNGRTFIPTSLGMISLKDVINKRNGITYEKTIKSMKIPESALLGGFFLFKDFETYSQYKNS